MSSTKSTGDMTVEEMKEELDSDDIKYPPIKSKYPVSNGFSTLSYIRCKIRGGHIAVNIDAGTFAPRIQQCVKCGKTVSGDLNKKRYATEDEVEANQITKNSAANHVRGPF